MRVLGAAPMGGEFVEIVLDERLCAQPCCASRETFCCSRWLISSSPRCWSFALHYLLVRPMRRITANMMSFRDDPEIPRASSGRPSRDDEIGMAESELAAMQRDLASMLQQQRRLAALGLAVSKINHDLRNLLASAQLFSDQLSIVRTRECSASRRS